MATEFTVRLEDRPGTLDDVAEALGNAGVNIDGIQSMPCEGWAVIQMLINDVEGARKVFDAAGVKYSTREVLLLNLANKPGALARVTRAMREASININAVYCTITGQVVLGAEDLEGAQEVVSRLGVT